MQLADHAITSDALSQNFAALADRCGGPCWWAERGAGDGQRAGGAVRAQPADGVAASQGAGDGGRASKARDAQFRPCKLEPERLEAADAWLAQYRAFFSPRFDRLAEQLAATMARKPSETGEK